MKKALSLSFILALFVFLPFSAKNIESSFAFAKDDSLKVLVPEDQHQKSDLLIMTLLSRYHYKKFDVNDSLSSVVLDNLIESLDYSRMYFLASDINEFEKYRNELDDNLKIGKLQPAFDIYNRFLERLQTRVTYINQILDTEFDFSKDEFYQTDRKNAPWATDENELNEIWRKRLKNEALNLKIAGKEWKDISETLKKRYSNFQKRMFQSNSEDVFQLYMNQFAEAIDPHTNYFSPKTSEDFKINMSLSLEGIGATLSTEDDYTKVVDLVVGGPAFKSKAIQKGDKIIGVAQGAEGEMVDVIGWRVDEVVKLIRGPKGSTVRLQIMPSSGGASAIPKEVKIVRDKIKLEEQAAKKEVIETNVNGNPYKLGVVKIPTFYFDYESQRRGDPDYKSTTKDVRKLIKELEKEKVDGIIIDLRNNGGGSLQEAIELTGLFIKDGPVVQVRNSDGSVDVGEDPDPDMVYDGPLAVMVNRFSASASEIFAGAIQDYERGLVVGETTFGKGTVQNLINLNRFATRSNEKLGELKLTIAKFYRIDGGSTQHRGVIPDLKLPSAIDTTEYGESTENSALPWDKIQSADYESYGNISQIIPELEEMHKKRVSKDIEFKNLEDEISDYREKKNRKEISLNEDIRKKEHEAEEQKKIERRNLNSEIADLEILEGEEVETSEKKAKDVLLKETANILTDMILLSENKYTKE